MTSVSESIKVEVKESLSSCPTHESYVDELNLKIIENWNNQGYDFRMERTKYVSGLMTSNKTEMIKFLVNKEYLKITELCEYYVGELMCSDHDCKKMMEFLASINFNFKDIFQCHLQKLFLSNKRELIDLLDIKGYDFNRLNVSVVAELLDSNEKMIEFLESKGYDLTIAKAEKAKKGKLPAAQCPGCHAVDLRFMHKKYVDESTIKVIDNYVSSGKQLQCTCGMKFDFKIGNSGSFMDVYPDINCTYVDPEWAITNLGIDRNDIYK